MSEDSQTAVREIQAIIRSEEKRLRSSRPWLAHQDRLGLTAFLGSLLLFVMLAWLYLAGYLVWWLAVPLIALPLSILHELEHDLIHRLFFRRRVWLQNFVLFVVWWCKLSINPWYRRDIHMKHHRESGQTTDIEERLIGIGLPFGLLRLFVTIHPIGGVVLFPRIKRDVPHFDPLRLTLMSLPTYIFAIIGWEVFFGYIRVRTGMTFAWDPAGWLPAWGWPIARDFAVVLVLPNMLRQSCLAIVSSYCHYYSDIPERELLYQTQSLRSWLLWPFQLFCFNFGATHILHHFIASQPFYLRQMVAPGIYRQMEQLGARVNDFGVVARSNRWGTDSNTASDRAV